MKRIFLIIFILCISYNVYALDCPPSSTCTEPFEQNTWGFNLDNNSNINVSATLSYRYNCDGDFEMIIDNFESSAKNIDFLEKFNYLHYSFSSASEMLALDFLMNNSSRGTDHRTIPLCTSDSSITRVFVYTASCGIWTRCSYDISDSLHYICDNGWSGGFPHYEDGGKIWIDHWKWQSCGDVCCRKVFEICRESYVDKPGTFVKIKALTKEKYPGSECSEQDTFWGKRQGPETGTNQPLQCEDGC